MDIKDLTLDEKLMLLTGKNLWQTHDLNGKITSVFMSDGPNGLRKEEIEKTADGDRCYIRAATAMPTLSAVANSWNDELSYLDGKTIADECVEANVDVLLAPGVNIKRNVLNGRNFEYFSEDPYLSGRLAKAYISGVQDKGIGASVKHFVANNSEYDRFYMSSEVDERTLHEIYMPAFEEAVKAKPWTVMCSYNPINGVHASQNKKMLKGMLRDKLGFDGLIVSDWQSVHDHPKAVKATLDLRMPFEKEAFDELKSAYDKGEIIDEEIDACIKNLFMLIDKKEKADKIKKVEFTKEQRHGNALKIAEESMVLLKNDDGVLPLKKGSKVSVFGPFNQEMAQGGGSAKMTTDYVGEPLSMLLEKGLGEKVVCGKGAYGPLLENMHELNRQMQVAYNSDVAIVCVGETHNTIMEGRDRVTLKLTQAQEKFIVNMAKYCENVVVVVYCGGAIDMSAWIDKVKAVVYAGYAGEAANEAVSSVLLGTVNPSGKLTETFPMCVEDSVTGGRRDNLQVDYYSEGVLVGYRHYDTLEKPVLYPFGHGLSYSKFEYSNLNLEKKGDTNYVVSFDITNISDKDGKEISQLYVRDVLASVLRPVRELKGYSKDLIKAGETKRISMELDFRSFAYYSVVYDEWTIENGDFEIEIGSSSRDIKLKAKINIQI